MSFRNWVGRLFANDIQGVSASDIPTNTTENSTASLGVEVFAVNIIAETIAALMSKCKINTYEHGEMQKREEWYSLNYQPNINQTAGEFWTEFYYKLLTDQQVLIFESNGQRNIADAFVDETNGITQTLFTQVSKNQVTFNKTFRRQDVIYLTFNNRYVAEILSGISSMYDEFVTTAFERYKAASGRKGVLKVGTAAQGGANFKEKFKAMQETYFKQFFNSTNAVLPLFEGFDYQEMQAIQSRYTSEQIEICDMLKNAIEKIGLAYRIHPALFLPDTSKVDEAVNYTIMACISPIAESLSKELTCRLYTKKQIMDGSYIKVDISSIKYIDLLDVANSVDKLIASGFMSINEVRNTTGLDETDEEWGNKHWITKNYSAIDDVAEQSEALTDSQLINAGKE